MARDVLKSLSFSGRDMKGIKAEAFREAKEVMAEMRSKDSGALYALAFAKACWSIVKRGSDWRRAKFAEIDERLAQLEARSLPEAYRGVFDLEAKYSAGQLLTHQGGLWMALRDVQGEKPGPSPAYRLVLKAGSR